MGETPLSRKMRDLALTHPRGAELLRLAQELDDVTSGIEFNPKKTVGAWARARRCWSECSGEPLI